MVENLRIVCFVFFEALASIVRYLDRIDKALNLSMRAQYSFDIRQSVESRNIPQGTESCRSKHEPLVDSDVRFRVYKEWPLDQKDRRRKVEVGASYAVVGIKV
jgi:hypothetical protein